jgi:hypothetical protein
MPMPPLTAFALLVLSSAAFGCTPKQQAPPAVASPASVTAPPSAASASHASFEQRHVYRFDFVLTANDGASPASSTSFTLNLQEGEKGEMIVGKNVPLSRATPTSSGPPSASPRQDVGMKVVAMFRTAGDDVILDMNTEMSASEPPSSIRKLASKGNALASPGKPALVTTLESDNTRYQLTVTPTKLR